MRSVTVFYENTKDVDKKLFHQSLQCEQESVSLLFDSVKRNEFTIEEILILTATRALQLKLILEHYQSILEIQEESFHNNGKNIETLYENLRAEAINEAEEKQKKALLIFANLFQTIVQCLAMIQCFQENAPEKNCDNELLLRYLGNFKNCAHYLTMFAFSKIPTQQTFSLTKRF